MIHTFVSWLRTLDPKSFAYALAATVLVALFSLWRGGFKATLRRVAQFRGLRKYKRELRDSCLSLTVVGRRQGFSLDDTYIPLDLAPSDLAPNRVDRNPHASNTQVIVAGPGAGKSTLVKRRILDFMDTGFGTAFLIRLREYDPQKSIQFYLAEQLRNAGVPEPEVFVGNTLRSLAWLCVLDGLDEVRQTAISAVYERINTFYQETRNFERGTLIVTCRKEAYRDLPLEIAMVLEVRPLTDEQIGRFANKWPLPFPTGKSATTFLSELSGMPRILELTRSPLLLVGGLMQYTESNLGLPEERVQYLGRIAQWLVSDWANAQGHPPDKYRPVYIRILSRLALQMHLLQTSEYAAHDALLNLGTWLPDYGFESHEAGAVLNGIITKTGILVRDLPNIIIFSQFGLQEYFASVDLFGSATPDELTTFASGVWWKEVFLLCTAQLREPRGLIELLFLANPLLAAEAVAEAPVPSIDLQGRAARVCVGAIDDTDPIARSATVRLLRKVRGPLEGELVSALEQRLAIEGVAKDVGLILATAGTPGATAALERHPEIWESCFQDTGFFSNTLENLLVARIRSADIAQSMHATDLLVDRLSHDRFKELLEVLPTLPEQQRNHLASGLVEYIAIIGSDGDSYREISLVDVTTCVSYVQRDIEASHVNFNSRWNFRMSPAQCLIPALALKRGLRSVSPTQLHRTLVQGLAWARYGSAFFCWTALAIGLTTYKQPYGKIPVLLSCPIAIYSVSVYRRYAFSEVRWPIISGIAAVRPQIAGALTLIGFYCAAMCYEGLPYLPISNLSWSVAKIAFICGGLGFFIDLNERRFIELDWTPIFYVKGLVAVAMLAAAIGVIFHNSLIFVGRYAINVIGAVLAVILVYFGVVVFVAHRETSRCLQAIDKDTLRRTVES